MIKSILLASVFLVQLSCGGGSGGGISYGSRGQRNSVNLPTFTGRIYKPSLNTQAQFQSAVDAFMSAVINPTPKNLGVVSGLPADLNSGIVFLGSVAHDNFNIQSGSSVQLVVADTAIEKSGEFASTFRHYIPSNLPAKERPYVNLVSNSDCVDSFRAYFEDSSGDITIGGNSFIENGDLWVGGKVWYENDSCYCDNNFCKLNYCDFWSGTDRKALGFLGDFKILYKDFFSRACQN